MNDRHRDLPAQVSRAALQINIAPVEKSISLPRSPASTAPVPGRSTRHCRRLFYALLLAFAAASLAADPSSPLDDAPDWTWDEFDPDTDAVNEGELRFLAVPPADAVHHHHNDVTLAATSRVDGWVQLRQCHRNIDRVARAQILFRKGRVRNIVVTESINVGRAWVEGDSVQLVDIGNAAILCIDAESLALVNNANGSYSLNNGPFMRRFLDGYYPMNVSSEVALGDSGLRFAGITPVHQPGFKVEMTASTIRYNAWFEGRLQTEIRLVPE